MHGSKKSIWLVHEVAGIRADDVSQRDIFVSAGAAKDAAWADYRFIVFTDNEKPNSLRVIDFGHSNKREFSTAQTTERFSCGRWRVAASLPASGST